MLDGEPALDAAAVTDLIADHSWTVEVEAEDGTTTEVTVYDLHAAAAEGWRLKASKVSGDYQIGIDSGQALYRQQVYEHAVQQADYHASRARIRPHTVTRADVAY